jgi:hypothetical protein
VIPKEPRSGVNPPDPCPWMIMLSAGRKIQLSMVSFYPQGTALMSRGEVRTNQSKNWYALSEKLGCGGQAAGAATVTCLQGKPWKTIYDKSGGSGPSNDNKTLFADVYERARKGQFIKKASD